MRWNYRNYRQIRICGDVGSWFGFINVGGGKWINNWEHFRSSAYLDLGFDLTSEPDASFPLLLDDEKNDDDDFSFASNGLGTRPLPAWLSADWCRRDTEFRQSTYLCSLHSRRLTTVASAGLRWFRSGSRSEWFLTMTAKSWKARWCCSYLWQNTPWLSPWRENGKRENRTCGCIEMKLLQFRQLTINPFRHVLDAHLSMCFN